MKYRYLKLFCFGDVLLLFSFLASAYFFYWVVAASDDEQVHDALVVHGKFVVQEKRKEAYEYLNKKLAAKQDGPLDPIWLQLVRVNSSGYERLGYYLRILEGDPDREATYSEVANFIELAPLAFHDEVKQRYLTDMSKISGIRQDWLEEYNLLVTSKDF